MRKIALMIAGLGIAATAIPAASAQQGWWGMQNRKAQLDRRIDQGVRSGQLNRREAANLRNEFRQIVNLEQRYRRSAPGLTNRERQDLDNRFDRLAQRIRWERRDWQRRR